ncbi:MAG: glutaminyl-peptide cyclotransferase [Chloroflexi bacterium]|nr:glutaminyl-peptide cyclotransferase [Chloroflexota bacterium]MDL1883414.1 glutaminyl-peptide cyclotransferase [Anaerolineae bacterium CFX8]
MRRDILLTTALVLMSALLFSLAAAQSTATPAPTPTPTPRPADILVPEVIADYPHDAGAYTQGLLLHDGLFYESAGQYGESTLRQVAPETGEVLRQVDVPAEYFAEGLALVEDRLIQITWREQTAFVYDLETFEPVGMFEYEGEGWGLCYDGQQLFMSDGTDTLTIRDPQTFEATDERLISLEGRPVSEWAFRGRPLSLLNELECVDDWIYANIWYSDLIFQIDKNSGEVKAVIFAGDLLTDEERSALADDSVLNGIAYDPQKEVFYLTGKRWPRLFEVRFVTPD